jgi:predicted amidohydrolase YtcJ
MRILASAAFAVLVLAVVHTGTMRAGAQTPAAGAADPCSWSRDLRLVNGRIHTMDRRNQIVGEVTIRDGRFAAVGPDRRVRPTPCTRTIDLRGRTVVPGLIDNHNHIVLLGMRPGHDVRLDRVFSLDELRTAVQARARGVPAGEWITAMGGWNQLQFAEKRWPTLAELDAAAPAHPVILYQGFNGPAATNTRGKAFFESRGVTVGPGGEIAANAPSIAALNALRALQTFADQKRGTLDAMAYVASVGLTTNVDMGFNILPGTPDLKGSQVADGLASLNPWTAYDAFVALHRENKLTTRLRLFIYTQDTSPDTPILRERLLNHFSDFGDDMLRVSGIGEQVVAWNGAATSPALFEAGLKLVAQHGWAFQQHSLSLAEDQLIASTFEKINAVMPIAGLRWSDAHVPKIDQATVNRFKAVGAGLAVHPGSRYLGTAGGGPPFRMILDSGIHMGVGSDAGQVTTLSPWAMISYMVTGRNAGGEMVNQGQQITREEALRLYTAENGWFFREEDKLGSIEPGKLGDLAVLSADFFDPRLVPDDQIRRVTSVLTVVDGKVVHSTITKN